MSRSYYKETYMPDRQRLLDLALTGLEAERAKIDDEIAQIQSQLNPRPATAQTAPAGSSTPPKRRRMSAAARKKISEAMKRRYAAMRTSAISQLESAVSQRSRLTAAGRRKLSELMKAQWAAKRKAAAKK